MNNRTTLPEKSTTLVKRALKLMGNRFELTIQEPDPERAEELIRFAVDEIRRIEALLTTFQPDSETNRINEMAGLAPVEVSGEVLALIQRAQRISTLTQGAFDLSYGSLDKSLWNFDLNMKKLPSPALAKKSVRLINYQNIEVDPLNKTVFLKEKGMRIGFGGIGKGYAADRAKELLVKEGVTTGIVNASGDLTAWGKQENGEPWTIGIADPRAANHLFSYINITDMSVATSGNYEKFVEIGGKRYSHTIDPRTGMPVSGIKSVTIISPYAELSDALATPVMVMGKTVGLDLLNQMKQVAALVIDENNRLHTTRNIQLI
ncbi:FAD:protein FMN transferase [Flavihumibacter sp. CACIAM 22H1]|uniref:FAD:protein FMN transferase n=1 Tax=Flavihumibacter sp. CACIAM 22H1 TaxID=1812911 RepID=UPI0007A8A022|nr:FAD:protein FMN transferase [Flavihumibacter sp. CACIAM 22H1]KYP14449.1 MAG: thiamine biosynthesis protein ApbE [Flavihumibacter sp. CACIAM 22H1]